MARRPRDERGYPILFTTPVTENGPDFFTIGTAMVKECKEKSLCGPCGEVISHHDGPDEDCYPYYFIGGPYSAEITGVFTDPPMHKECAEFAMSVCPWMIATNYKRPATYQNIPLPDGGAILESRARPPVLCLVKALNYERGREWGYLFKAVWPKVVRYWNPRGGGDEVDRAEIDAFLDEGFKEMALKVYDDMKESIMARHAAKTMLAFGQHLKAQVERGEISEEEANETIRKLTGRTREQQ